MKKIRTLVAHDDENVKNNIVDIIKKFDYVEVVGTASDGTETYNKILEIRPEMVFAKYNMKNMNGLEIARKSKENLEENLPIFNMICNSPVNEENIKDVYKVIGNNLNTFVTEPVSYIEIDNIMQEYKKYIENK